MTDATGLESGVAARLIARAAQHPERLAIMESRQRVTFAELASRVAALSLTLRRKGVRPGDRVLVFVPMSIRLYVTLLGVFHAGASAVFVDAWADRKRLEAAVEAARPQAFAGSPKAHLLRLTSAAVRRIPTHLMIRRSVGRQAASVDVEPIPVTPDTDALITFTTGSTGRPKAAARSHGFLWAQHEVLAAHLGMTEEDVDMPTLPVFVLNNLACGVPSVLPDFDPRRPADIDPVAIHRQMVQEGVTTSSGSPAFYDTLCAWAAARSETLPLRKLFTGGAPVLPPLARLLADLDGTEAHVLYGSTEAEPISSISARDMIGASGKTGDGLCAGPPVPQIDVRLVRPHDAVFQLGERGWAEWEVAAGEPGEILVSGRHVLPGYVDDPEADRANKVSDGERIWHRTGDAGRFDADGRIWLMGRVKQRVQRNDKTWWPLPAEVRAMQEARVGHAAYLGVSDKRMGQRAVLCVEVAGGRLDATARRSLEQRVHPWPIDELVVLERIPRDPRHASKTNSESLLELLQRERDFRQA